MENTRPAPTRRRAARQLARRSATCAITCTFLALVNLLATPGHWWVAWVAIGWGLDIALHTARYLTRCDEDDDRP